MATRKVADCRKFPSETNCSLTIAGTEEEVLTVAVRHAIEDHKHAEPPEEIREQVRTILEEEKVTV